MNYITNNIGTNKVTISISPNNFEETNLYVEEENLFNSIENIIDIYKNSNTNANIIKSNIIQSNIKKKIDIVPVFTKSYSQEKTNKSIKEIESKSKSSIISIKGFDSLLFSILEYIDPAISLLSNDIKIEKINNFKNTLILSLDIIKIKISRDNMRKYIETGDNNVCIYISKIINVTIILKINTDFEIYGNLDNCICLSKDDNNEFNIDSINSLIFYKNLIIMDRIHKYHENNILEKLNSFLLKDLKEIADKIDILTFKIEENKKKNYLKNELKDIIKIKLEEHK